MSLWPTIKRPPWRTVVVGCVFFLLLPLAYAFWQPGLDVRDGRHDNERNGIWISHGWLGADEWFIRYNKTNQFPRYRDRTKVRELASLLRRHHITDVFPHLCPADLTGQIPAMDTRQAEMFLDEFAGFRVIPWIGGPNGNNVRGGDAKWRGAFCSSVRALFTAHPRLAGVQLNVEPLTSGDMDFLKLLDEVRNGLPKGKILSIAAYPPPTRWHPYQDVHWSEDYFRQVALRSDQMAVMMYDAAIRLQKPYQRLMADWTEEALLWSESRQVLLGVPTYDDTGVGYHDPRVENLRNALLGIHRGLTRNAIPTNYQGIAIYSEWETDADEWHHLREHFLRR